jgi:hypothetical protein
MNMTEKNPAARALKKKDLHVSEFSAGKGCLEVLKVFKNFLVIRHRHCVKTRYIQCYWARE